MKKTLILAGIVLSALFYGQSAQDFTTNTNNAGKHIPKISPTSPESFKFSQYGNIPIGMFTGAPNINIPITELSVDGTSIPISLNYASNGINVDEMNGSVGLGWTFISGGVITRTIRDRADEESSFGSGDVPLTENFATQLDAYLTFCENDDFDSEPDLYSANFGGYNVKFLINKAGKIIMVDQKDYQILRNDSGNLFSIILDNGVRYNFNATEHIQNRTLNTGGHQPPQQYIQSWYLSSIVTTSGQTLTLEYQDVSYTTILSQSQTMTYTKVQQYKYGDLVTDANGHSSCPQVPYTIVPNLGLIADSEQYAAGKQLKKIYDSNNNSIVFTYSAQNEDYSKLSNIKKYHNNIVIDDYSFNYTTTGASRLFLNEIRDNKTQSSHKFTYYSPEILPSRLSFSRDVWGYYNGSVNTNLVPQLFVSTDPTAPQYNGASQGVSKIFGYFGLLKMVSYPTGGNTLFNYENHKRKENVLIPAVRTNVQINTFTPQNDFSTTKEVIVTPHKTGPVEVNLSNYLYPYGNCQGSPDLDTQKQEAHLEVRDQAGNLIANLDSSLNNSSQIIVNGVKDQPLKFTLTAMFFCCNAYAQIYYYDQEDQYELRDALLGGYRISSTIDTPNDGLPVTRKYNYIRDNGEYSIHVTREPVFVEDRSVGSLCYGSLNSQPAMSSYTAITSSNIGRLFSFNPNIFYDTVEEQIEGKGKTVHYFSSDTDYPGNPIKGGSIISAPWTNSGWKNGKELLTLYKDNAGSTLKTVETKYTEDPTRTSYLGGISRRKIYEPIANNGTWTGDYPNMDVVYYKNISRFAYLESQKTTDYFNGTPLESKTEYFYNNPAHHQLSKERSTTNDVSPTTQETTYSYAQEKGNPLLISKNMVGISLETTTTLTTQNTTKTLDKTETLYPTTLPTSSSGNLVLPLSVISYDQLNGNSSTDITFNKYDDKGNILQYTTEDGNVVSFIWGYHGTEPIVKVEGMSYDQIVSTPLTSGIVSASNEDSSDPAKEGLLLDVLTNFRKQTALTGKKITTYTYDPLIGVTSMTSPSGIRQSFVYDPAGKLKEALSRKKEPTGGFTGKKTKTLNYNYKQ
ncbi:hypothetical protein C1637_21975 [Chryseobacterium lactis]|uniref:RHS repeat protein n=1 Tax=Chryseobacterium lactis TaxID=1241981 RepID=A0A3G6RQ22_CHRLC|nr:hypothetical protein [Chryseobacterium lactis]AZA84951.1 hypothetical protein EG342_24935 [Chryseobacterium lactis]AZB05339.1 hypothetical protein EG341_15815 [Chryseobacterium lactis]PNW11488.1 hypothetical protein C1637_21975 [Chryseobacterium lactis]